MDAPSGADSQWMRSVSLSVAARSRANNFDVLRLAAAGLVLVAHSFPLTGRRGPLVSHPLGTAGVEVFFAISGFLVTKSWLSQPSFYWFMRKRALRIFPGLVGAVTVTALVVGTLFTARSLTGYLGSREPWDYIVSNVVLVQHLLLPSVFATHPNVSANGSLWTLPVEMRAYILLALLGFAALVRRGAIIPLAILLVIVNAVGSTGPSLRLTSVFIGGSALYLLRDSVVLRVDLAAVLLGAWLIAYDSRFSTAVGIVALPYLVACVAYCSPARLRRLAGKGDVSYGVYVYAFPIQQSIIAVAGVLNPLLLTALAAPLAWLAGLASWRLIEEPMLRRKGTRGFRGKRAREPRNSLSSDAAHRPGDDSLGELAPAAVPE